MLYILIFKAECPLNGALSCTKVFDPATGLVTRECQQHIALCFVWFCLINQCFLENFIIAWIHAEILESNHTKGLLNDKGTIQRRSPLVVSGLDCPKTSRTCRTMKGIIKTGQQSRGTLGLKPLQTPGIHISTRLELVSYWKNSSQQHKESESNRMMIPLFLLTTCC